MMKAHILLVEDDYDLRDMLALTLRKAGYQVTEASDGRQAITLLAPDAQNPDPQDTQDTQGEPTPEDAPAPAPYDVVLTDIVMGEIDGIEVLNVARNLPDPPEVILLTGHGSLETAIEAVRNQAFDYLLKPSQKTRLLERIGAAVDYRRATQRRHRAIEIVSQLADFASSSQPAPPTGTSVLREPIVEPPPAEQGEQHRYREVGQLRIDTFRQKVFFAEQPVHTTPTEYIILACLAATPGKVVTFGDIIRRTHSYQVGETEAHDLLRSHIRNLRKKIDRRYLVSVYATGYMLVDPEWET